MGLSGGVDCRREPGAPREVMCLPTEELPCPEGGTCVKQEESSCSSRMYHRSSESFGDVSPLVFKEPTRRLAVRVVV